MEKHLIKRLNNIANRYQQETVMNIIKIIEEEVRFDIAEIYNNINDDLQMSKDGTEGYITHKEVVQAIKKYTLKVIDRKYKKYGGRD